MSCNKTLRYAKHHGLSYSDMSHPVYRIVNQLNMNHHSTVRPTLVSDQLLVIAAIPHVPCPSLLKNFSSALESLV